MVARKTAPTRSYRADLRSGLDSGVRLLGDDCTVCSEYSSPVARIASGRPDSALHGWHFGCDPVSEQE